jgi:phage tail-like protein
MTGESGYLYLNAGGDWPAFSVSPTLEKAGGVLRLQQSGASFEPFGAFLAGPFQVSHQPTSWFRVQVTPQGAEPAEGAAPELDANVHAQFFTFTSAGPAAPWNPGSDTPFTDPGWKAAPRDALDFTIPNQPGLQLFLGGILRGDGTASPLLDQVRVLYGRDTYAKFLPPMYRADDVPRDLLERFLGIEQSVLEGVENKIAGLPRLFDPAASPAGEPPSWLGWLSGWLTWVLDEHWTEPQARAYLAQAFELYGWRGTVEGLRRYLRIYAGVEAHIEEPAQQARIWSLGDSVLGFSTMLAAGPLQGAVLGSSAVVDQSQLTTGEDFGAALFEDLAHHFCVRVYCGELTRPRALDTVREVLDREKPAHCTYDLCVIEPRMRVGVQASIGIDSIVGGGPPPAGISKPLGSGALAAAAEPCTAADLALSLATGLSPAAAEPCDEVPAAQANLGES